MEQQQQQQHLVDVDVRQQMLADRDIDALEDVEFDSGDSGVEDDAPVGHEERIRDIDVGYHRERLLENIYCVSVSYVRIRHQEQRVVFVCQYCYAGHSLRIGYGRHKHVNIHAKRTLLNTSFRKFCIVCRAPLWQLILADVCVLCNGGTSA